MKKFAVALLAVFIAACAPVARGPMGEGVPPAEEGRGKGEPTRNNESRGALPARSGTQSVPSDQEKAKFLSAYQLARSGNPDKDYDRAAKEFEEFLASFPAGAYTEEASSWLALIRLAQQAREMERELGKLRKTTADVETRLRDAEAGRDAAAQEHDALVAEKIGLMGRIDGLESGKGELLREKAGLVKERDELAAEKAALAKKVDTLTKEKEWLAAAKARAEKRLRDLSEVDVRMEKERKKAR